MTSGLALVDVTPPSGGSSEARNVRVGGVTMSALVQEVPRPRAVVLALHGGATTSVYYDGPGHPRMSLLRTGAALGFTVVALDRPGYGASAPFKEELGSAERRVDLAYGALDLLVDPASRGAGVFVLAHSSGCELGIRMAGDERRAGGLLGLELAGTGRHRHARAMRLWTDRDPGRRVGPALREILWGPPRLYPDDLVGGASIAAPVPPYEGVEAGPWPERLPEFAARVRVPVHYSLGEHEMWWRSGREALADIASLFTASPRVAVHEQAEGGHNLSLGHSALAYHLEILSFVEECVLAGRGRGEVD